jgi:hypothetical protein
MNQSIYLSIYLSQNRIRARTSSFFLFLSRRPSGLDLDSSMGTKFVCLSARASINQSINQSTRRQVKSQKSIRFDGCMSFSQHSQLRASSLDLQYS